MRFLLRLLISAAALWVAVRFVDGVSYTGDTMGLILIALIFGLVNAIVRPVLVLLSCPLIVLTLGLGIFIINAAMLLLTAAISRAFGIGFEIDGIIPALIATIVIGLVSMVLNVLLGTKRDDERERDRLER
jgi:putative membrane protein